MDPAQTAALARELAGMLRSIAARDEQLAEWVPPRRVMLVSRGPSMRALGRVWRLGALLLDAEGGLRETGRIIRVEETPRRSIQSATQEERILQRQAARRAGFPLGETVVFDADPIPLDEAALAAATAERTGPLVLRDGEVLVRWAPHAGDAALAPVEGYLRDRAALLAEPPRGT
ncbi:hypothetical protein [Homoserinibacter sp. YIM 151385]|uniref:hypothetical protein n=1 Tax=Homoserinibacter sp. YIM 151385 TaxID=2985506 RepID=UPI0022F06990|nr:hypothetical protein [Homoserinibacter sp. YIM 151385]WBU38103.1 hypothetical protein OF852_00535 [Homoserinibacter sp. YIM 151385]